MLTSDVYERGLPEQTRRFYRRWVIANGWSESLGLGTTFVIGGAVSPWLAYMDGWQEAIAGACLAVTLGMMLEGVLVGFAQERAIRQRLQRLAPGAWTKATSIGAGLAWLLGMLPSTLIAIVAAPPAAGEVQEPSVLVKYLLAAAMGATVGPVLGVAQWSVLRQHVVHAGRWLWANALAWLGGMTLVFMGMDLVPWTAPTPVIWFSVYLVCGVVGVVVGAIHGLVLCHLEPTAPLAVGVSSSASAA